MIINETYKTRLRTEDVKNWIESKGKERLKVLFFKQRLYTTKYNDSGFMIREIRLSKQQSFKPRVIGRFQSSYNKLKINIRILPSYTGMLLFSIVLIVLPIVIFSSDNIKTNGVLTSDLSKKIEMILIDWLVALPLMYFVLIRPVYKAKTWIENELKLDKIDNNEI